MDRLALADALEKAINDPDTTPEAFGEYARWNLPTILAALRSTSTDRSEAEAMREACAKLCERRADYSQASPGYREWADAGRSYRCTAQDLRELRLPAGRTALNPSASEVET